jgi:HK97 family phage portal protein
MNKIQTFILKVLGYEQRNMSPALTAMMLGETPTASGVNVSETNAMRTSAVYACVRVIAQSMASIPLITYRHTKTGKERALDHKLYSILHDSPNPEMTAFEFRMTMMASLLLWGNAYAEIETNARGDVLALWPLLPGMMEVMRARPAREGERGQLYYHYQLPDGGYQDLIPYQIMHIRGLSFNGLVGLSPIQMAREAIGLSMATQEFGARFFGNGARPGVYLEHPGKLGDKAYERLLGSWNATHQGLANSHRATILEEGMKLETVGVPPEDAQFLETRNFQVEEIARIFNVPLHKIGDLRRATFSNIEHQSIGFVVDTLLPWATCWEQAITRDLIGPLERNAVYAKFLLAGLLRGDQQTRYASYAQGRQWGWLSVNDVRRLEDMNEIPEGDVYLEPLNMKDAADESPEPQASASGAPAEEPAANSARDWSMLYEDAVARIRKRAARDIDARRAKLTPEKLSEWWAEYRAGDLDAYAQLVLGPLATTIGRDARQWAADVIRSLDSGAPRDAAGAQPVITINVPPQPAPVVHVDAPVVHVAAPPAPYVVVDVAAPPAPSVTINSPRIAEENQTIERDAKGNITSTTTTVTYEGRQ